MQPDRHGFTTPLDRRHPIADLLGRLLGGSQVQNRGDSLVAWSFEHLQRGQHPVWAHDLIWCAAVASDCRCERPPHAMLQLAGPRCYPPPPFRRHHALLGVRPEEGTGSVQDCRDVGVSECGALVCTHRRWATRCRKQRARARAAKLNACPPHTHASRLQRVPPQRHPALLCQGLRRVQGALGAAYERRARSYSGGCRHRERVLAYWGGACVASQRAIIVAAPPCHDAG